MKPIPQTGMTSAVGSGEIVYEKPQEQLQPQPVDASVARKLRVEMFRRKLGTKKPSRKK